MPKPTATLATLRPDLASMMEFNVEADRLGFIGLRCLPVLEVALQASPFGKIPIEQLLKVRNTSRAPGTGYSRSSFTFTTDSYATVEHGAEEPVDQRQAKMYANYFDAEAVALMRARDAVLRNAEIRAAALLFDAAVWTGATLTTVITNEWDVNHKTNAVPIDDVEGAVRKVWSGCGLWPNALIVNRTVFRNLRNLDQIVDRITASGAGSPAKPSDITPAMLAAVFDLEEVIVAGGAKDSATEGQATTIGNIWSNEYAMLARIARTNDIQEPCLGRTFHWAEDGSEIGGTVETYFEEQTRSDIERVRHDVCEKVLYVEAAHLLSNVTT